MRLLPLLTATSLTLLTVACSGGDQTTCGPAECAAICAEGPGKAEAAEAPQGAAPQPDKAAKGSALTAFEATMLATALEDVRAGVRPFNDNAIGVCKGSGKECPDYLGAEPGELPPGEYMVRAELAVPNVGPRGTWKITFATECKTTYKADNGDVRTTESNRSRDYDVSYAGTSRGYRLSPLMKIKSPNAAGTETCSYTITAPHGDGDKVYSGSWTVPQGK